jgi:hypothetical protein
MWVALSATGAVLRGRALEILDDHGRVRAMIKVFPPSPAAKMPDGTTGYPETVLLWLVDSKGAPQRKHQGGAPPVWLRRSGLRVMHTLSSEFVGRLTWKAIGRLR